MTQSPPPPPPPPPRTRRGTALFIAALAVAIIGALALRVVLEGRTALAEGDAALAAKRTPEAIAAWETAARWYLPGAPHVDEAYSRLVHTARTDPPHALAAWRAVRAAARATRSLWTPHAGELAEADAAIAKLSAADPAASRGGGDDPAARETWHRDMLARDPRPRIPAAALAALGLVAWVAGIAAFVRRGLDATGRLLRRPALTAAGLAAGGLAAWLLGLYLA